MQTEDYCPGTADFMVLRNKRGSFADLDGELELVGFTNCGGCPGKRVALSAQKGTTNALADGANDAYNGCYHCKGHTKLKGKGVLNGDTREQSLCDVVLVEGFGLFVE